ncbi:MULTISPECIES: hypothetical protein [Rhodococcus]|uniref:hypothetical protein n=1 Tax=Rhodococcus TaxID=1827 RepID=UPI000AD71B10|nr:hypothetical protein [Rhodococcus globerulus]
MIRKLFVIIAAAVMAIAGIITATAAPASAHHAIPGNWGNYITDWVSVADRTTPFPIDSATQTWDNGLDSNRINLTYHWWDCASSNGCVMIWENPNLGSAYYGVAQPQFDGAGNYRGANIQLNTSTAVTPNQRLKTSCHEIGHALGLDEHPGGPAGFRGSCMVQGPADGQYPVVTYPDWHDFDVVNARN